MKNNLLLFLIILPIFSYGQDYAPVINLEGEQYYCVNVPLNIVTSVTISDAYPSVTTLLEIFVQIEEGYELGSDTLFLSGSHTNISSVWDATKGQLTLIGPATFSDFESALLDVQFQTTQTTFTEDRQFLISLGNPNYYLASTGHYYIYVYDIGISWTEAKEAAAIQTYFGLQGYLATITSQEEAQFSAEQSTQAAWIGASDAETEGIWKWVTGPESGTIFWQGPINGNPVNNSFVYWNYNQPDNYQNEDYGHIIDPTVSGTPGSWNDLPNQGEGSQSPYHPKGYLVEFGGMPSDPQINLTANSKIIMPRITPQDIVVCAEEESTISISSNIDDINWFSSETSNTILNSGFYYTTTLTETTTFWIAPVLPMCNNPSQRIPITVTVSNIPSVNDITIIQCEDDIIDGVSVFNLSTYNAAIINGDLANMTVQFYSDIALNSQIDSESYTNESNNQTIFALVTNTLTQCINVSEIILTVNSAFTESLSLEICDNFEETGMVPFNLDVAENLILTNEGSDKSIEGFYETYNDALLKHNQISNNYTNIVPYNQSIYARVLQNGNCYSIVEVNLIVKRLPELLDDEIIYYCLNTYPKTITLYSGIVNDIAENFYYDWSTGETSININVNELGTYTVNVTKPFGCTNQRIINVLPSETATLHSIEIKDVSENNTITVIVSGDGVYSYSLDNKNGPYKESNYFEYVPSGIHTVYVKDLKANCGIVSEDVLVLGFPKFFTPNGDTVNDTWQISGFSSQFPVTAIVKIFNRYGKLITILDGANYKWDGSYKGKLLPTDDYWFLVELSDNRTFKGHFTLKR